MYSRFQTLVSGLQILKKSYVTSDNVNEGEKNHKKGGGLNCVFQNFFFYVQELFSGSESERGSESD